MNKRRSVSSKTCPVKCDAKGIEAAMLNGQRLCVRVCVCVRLWLCAVQSKWGAEVMEISPYKK